MECSFHPFFVQTAIVCSFLFLITKYLLPWSALFILSLFRLLLCVLFIFILLNTYDYGVLFSSFLWLNCYCVLIPSIYNIEHYLLWSALFILSLFKLLLCPSPSSSYWFLTTQKCSFLFNLLLCSFYLYITDY